MFKPVHGVNGTVISALAIPATTLILDDATLCLLKRRLSTGDYTYLLLRQGYDYEIVKTAGFVANGVTVIRAQDNTVALAINVGAQVEFVLGAAAIQDIIVERGLAEVNIEGKGIITVVKNATNSYTISAPPIAITSDSPNILVGGAFPNFTLSAPVLTDCCD